MSDSTETYVRFKSLRFLGYPDYRVGTDGSVETRKERRRGIGNAQGGWGVGKWKRIKEMKRGKYLAAVLSHGGKATPYSIHRLVLLAFVGDPPEGKPVACHNNGKHHDNRLENLRWDCQKGNLADRKAHGTERLGEQCHNSKLTDEDVRWIRKIWKGRLMTQKQMGIVLGRPEPTIQHVCVGRHWTHVRD